MLTNDRLIGVDQDGVAAKRVVNSGVKQVWSKRESSGAYVVALFNTGTTDRPRRRLWEVEFGNSSKDELNLIKPGANYAGRPARATAPSPA
ncbi:PQQ-dependent sugar dehydrogenase [Streptomyces flaveolus]